LIKIVEKSIQQKRKRRKGKKGDRGRVVSTAVKAAIHGKPKSTGNCLRT
jgi:hypothetical protein